MQNCYWISFALKRRKFNVIHSGGNESTKCKSITIYWWLFLRIMCGQFSFICGQILLNINMRPKSLSFICGGLSTYQEIYAIFMPFMLSLTWKKPICHMPLHHRFTSRCQLFEAIMLVHAGQLIYLKNAISYCKSTFEWCVTSRL